MPTYLNENDYAVNIGIPSLYLAADSSTITDRYIAGTLPLGVSLSAHTPIVKPWVLLVADEDTDLYDVSSCNTIIIYNGSDDVATISANTDDANALTVAAHAKEFYSNGTGLFGCLEILTGTGVLVWGSR